MLCDDDNGVMSGFMVTRKKKSRTKRQNIWHHPHAHHSPPSSNHSLIPRIPERKGTRTRNGNGGIGWRCIRSSINCCLQVYLFKLTKHKNQHILFHLRLFLPSPVQTKPTVLYIRSPIISFKKRPSQTRNQSLTSLTVSCV